MDHLREDHGREARQVRAPGARMWPGVASGRGCACGCGLSQRVRVCGCMCGQWQGVRVRARVSCGTRCTVNFQCLHGVSAQEARARCCLVASARCPSPQCPGVSQKRLPSVRIRQQLWQRAFDPSQTKGEGWGWYAHASAPTGLVPVRGAAQRPTAGAPGAADVQPPPEA